MPEWVENWCGRVGGLTKFPDGTWSSGVATDVSFPIHVQSELARVEDGSYWFAHRNNVIANVVDLFPPPGPIVDVGGGNGFVSRGLIQRGYDAIVVEPGEMGAKTCRARNVPVVQAAFQDIFPPKNGTPAIGLFDVLEHIEDDATALARIYETLTPGGMFYVAVPAYQSLWSQDDIDGGHFRRYTLSSLREKLNACGFTVEYETYFFASLVFPLFLVRTVPTMLRRRSNVTMAQTTDEHTLPKGMIGDALRWSFGEEERVIRRGRTVPFGTSCLIAARKPR
ncbi:class I SAM-dependent methyltransferase [Neorhizobium vignae]|uniref:class I SAM-dependent methyltransferase n=1 Tax=Neorhizobium vignae TaxID=690585 RepID=UPI00138E34DD|nr:class I SAM-dependent methyltransferase [Neorhizobium vignae]